MPKFTLKMAKARLFLYGMTINKQDTGEYRVAFEGSSFKTEPSAYYSDDIDDAVNTGIAMADKRDQKRF